MLPLGHPAAAQMSDFPRFPRRTFALILSSADISRLSFRPRASPRRRPRPRIARRANVGDEGADGAAERIEGSWSGGQAIAATGHDDRRRAARRVLAVDRLRRSQQYAGHPHLALDARARVRRGAAAEIRDRPLLDGAGRAAAASRRHLRPHRDQPGSCRLDRRHPRSVVDHRPCGDHLRDARQSGDGAARLRRGDARRDRPRRLCDDHDAQGRRAAPALRGQDPRSCS